MNIVFSPRRARKSVSGADFTLKIRRYKQSMFLEATLSAKVQGQLRYLDGDRVRCEFDPDNRAWELTRISPDKSEEGYKVGVRSCSKKGGHAFAAFRIGCEPSQATAVLGSRDRAEYELLEVTGNKATFVERT